MMIELLKLLSVPADVLILAGNISEIKELRTLLCAQLHLIYSVS